jgi:hypothetical protein
VIRAGHQGPHRAGQLSTWPMSSPLRESSSSLRCREVASSLQFTPQKLYPYWIVEMQAARGDHQSQLRFGSNLGVYLAFLRCKEVLGSPLRTACIYDWL